MKDKKFIVLLASVPDYRENPHIWKTMMENKCINIGNEKELLIDEAEPIKARPSEYFYKNAIDENVDETNKKLVIMKIIYHILHRKIFHRKIFIS